jgi:chromosome segregation ATPase
MKKAQHHLIAVSARTLLALVLAGAVCGALAADEKANREREQIRRMQAQQQKLSGEKAQLAQEKAALDEQVKKLTGDSDRLRKAEGGLRRRKAELEADLQKQQQENAALGTKLADLQQRFDKLGAEHKETERLLALRDLQTKNLQKDGAVQSARLQICESKAAKLYELGSEILTRYRKDPSCAFEPFMRLGGVQHFNIVQDYRDRLDSQKVDGNEQSK